LQFIIIYIFSVGKVISTLGYKEICIINRSTPSLWMWMVLQAEKEKMRKHSARAGIELVTS
jgi:hypothetical protein